MGDALCGPSNPLQSFQKHVSGDRSLQQDRLVSRNNAAQGFRSDPTQPAGLLDPEFEAFKAGAPPHFIESTLPPHFHQNYRPAPAPTPYQSYSHPGWVSDFQRLSLLRPDPAFSSQVQSHQQRHHPPSTWHQDFQQSLAPPTNAAPQNMFQSRMNYNPAVQSFQSYPYGQPAFASDMAQDKGKDRLLEQDAIDVTAFEREFEAHASQLLQQSHQVLQHESMDSTQTYDAFGLDTTLQNSDLVDHATADLSKNQQAMNTRQAMDDVEQPEHNQDNFIHSRPLAEHGQHILQESNQAQEHIEVPHDTDGELAATAGELLDRVSDNTTEKFKQSTFLALMSKLRDREVRVDGGQFVDVRDAIPLGRADNLRNNFGLEDREALMAGALNGHPVVESRQNPSHSNTTPTSQSVHKTDARDGSMAHEVYLGHLIDDF